MRVDNRILPPGVVEPAIKSGYSLSLQMFYNSALAIFGVVPMMALMVQSHKQGLHDQVRYCKNAFLEFKADKRFVQILSANQEFFNSNSLMGFDAIEIKLIELGYYENTTEQKLQIDLTELVRFINSQMQ